MDTPLNQPFKQVRRWISKIVSRLMSNEKRFVDKSFHKPIEEWRDFRKPLLLLCHEHSDHLQRHVGYSEHHS